MENKTWEPRVKVEKPQQEEEVKEPEKEKTLKDLLMEHSEAPSQAQLDEWKNRFNGEVYTSALSQDDFFIFRPLNRQEFSELQVMLSNPEVQLSQLDVEERIVSMCLLWSTESAQRSMESKAGTFSTVHEQIMQNSNFMNPAMASQLVIKL